MEPNVVQFPKQKTRNQEPVLDKEGRPIKHFFRSTRTGVIIYRRSLAKLGLPAINEATGEMVLSRARAKAELMLQDHKNRHLGSTGTILEGRTGRTMRQVAEEVLREVTPKKRARTQRKHRDIIGHLTEIFGAYDINSISRRDFGLEIEALRRKGTRTTFFDYSKHMNLIMRYAYNQRYATHLVTFPSPDQGLIKTSGRRFTHEEVKALWGKASEDMKDQLLLAIENVMRLREMLGLSWDRVNLETGEITLSAEHVKTGSKTGRGRSFIMSPGALKRLKARRERLPVTKWVFQSPIDASKARDTNHSAWRELKVEAGIRGSARWHDLRHTGLTIMLLEKRLNPLMVSEFAGVSMVTIQRVYLKPEARHTADVGKAMRIGD